MVSSSSLLLSAYQRSIALVSASGSSGAFGSFMRLMRCLMPSPAVLMRSKSPALIVPPHPELITSFCISPSASMRGKSALSESMTGDGLVSLPSVSVIAQLMYIFSEGRAIMRYMAAFSSAIFISSRLPRAKPCSLKNSFSSRENSPSVCGESGITPSQAPSITAAFI